MCRRVLGLALSALAFSVSYALVEYYAIRNTTFSYNPVLFSLIYPYHFAMAAVFGLAAYGLLRAQTGVKALVPSLIMAGALFSSMLAVEDYVVCAARSRAGAERPTLARNSSRTTSSWRRCSQGLPRLQLLERCFYPIVPL